MRKAQEEADKIKEEKKAALDKKKKELEERRLALERSAQKRKEVEKIGCCSMEKSGPKNYQMTDAFAFLSCFASRRVYL